MADPNDLNVEGNSTVKASNPSEFNFSTNFGVTSPSAGKVTVDLATNPVVAGTLTVAKQIPAHTICVPTFCICSLILS